MKTLAKNTIDPIAKLAEEHGLIFSMLEAFERCAECFQIGSSDSDDLMRFIIFFREYGELVHHEKEERIAFAALSAHGFMEKKGPRADLHDQHRMEKSLLSRITHLVVSFPPYSEVQRERLVALVVSYCTLQREHMKSENEHFYPALRKLLTDAESQLMAEELLRFDESQNSDGTLDWLLELAENLEQQYSGPERNSSSE